MAKKYKILVVGSGGREHALGWKLSQSPQVANIYFAPGNGGTNGLGENVQIAAEDIRGLTAFAKSKNIDLTVVGPEVPLSKGIVDEFTKESLVIFGPTKSAARLESSKVWAVRFMQKYNIPHPESHIFTQAEKAKNFIKGLEENELVVKADGLAAGKGVIVCKGKKEAQKAVDRIMVKKEFGGAGDKIIIQKRLYGPELSLLAFTDGKTVVPLLPAQDHKQVFTGDRGPNTGGMGAYTPVPFVKKQLFDQITKAVLERAVVGMQKEGCPYKGVLYAGLMLTPHGPKVLEFNVRFGDPEAQALLVLLKSDLLPILLACITGSLGKQKVLFHKGAALCVVLASKGYPGAYQKGVPIRGLQKTSNAIVFHAGTTLKDGQVVSSGGRVLNVTARAKTIADASRIVYNMIRPRKVYFKGMHYRKDIGKQALDTNKN